MAEAPSAPSRPSLVTQGTPPLRKQRKLNARVVAVPATMRATPSDPGRSVQSVTHDKGGGVVRRGPKRGPPTDTVEN